MADTTLSRLRDEVNGVLEQYDEETINDAIGHLTYGDARKLLALAEAVSAWNTSFDAPETDDPIVRDIVLDELRDNMDAALAAVVSPESA